jgi:hypothetical protein
MEQVYRFRLRENTSIYYNFMFTLDPSTLPLKKGLRVAYNSFTHVTLINTLVYISLVCNQALRAVGHSTVLIKV